MATYVESETNMNLMLAESYIKWSDIWAANHLTINQSEAVNRSVSSA